MREEPKFPDAFKASLAKWGGWPKLVSHNPTAYLEAISKSVEHIGKCQKERPATIGKLPKAEWDPIAETLPSFLNAFLQQALDSILEGPSDFLTALRLVDDNHIAQVLMASIIVAREHLLNVEVSYTSPFTSGRIETCPMFRWRQGSPILTLSLAEFYGEEHLPMVMHYHGEDHVLDKEASTKDNPVYVPVPVDRKGVIYADGLTSDERTKEQWERDEFLSKQGFQSIRFSPLEIQRDVFGCAAKAVEIITGKDFPTV